MQNREELLEKLVAFKSTQDNPEEIRRGLEYIASFFPEDRYDIKGYKKNGKYSLLVSFKGRDALHPKILLNGHFDVVSAQSEEQYTMRVEEGKAYGRGTLDMKGMVAVLVEVMLELGRSFDAAPVRGSEDPSGSRRQDESPDVALLLNGDEEMGGPNGARYLAQEIGMRPGFVLCPDGGGQKEFTITNKGKGIAWIELKAEGKEAHGAYVWKGENAIEKLMPAILKIKQFVGSVEPDAWKTTVNVGIVETSNKTPNKVPGDARAVLDIRFTEELGKTPEEVAQTVKNLVPEVQVRMLEGSPLLFVEESNPTLIRFKQAAEQVLGKQATFTYAHGAADIRYFTQAGISGALFGAIGQNMHAAGEWVSLNSLEQNKQILLKFLAGEDLSGGLGGSSDKIIHFL